MEYITCIIYCCRVHILQVLCTASMTRYMWHDSASCDMYMTAVTLLMPLPTTAAVGIRCPAVLALSLVLLHCCCILLLYGCCNLYLSVQHDITYSSTSKWRSTSFHITDMYMIYLYDILLDVYI